MTKQRNQVGSVLCAALLSFACSCGDADKEALQLEPFGLGTFDSAVYVAGPKGEPSNARFEPNCAPPNQVVCDTFFYTTPNGAGEYELCADDSTNWRFAEIPEFQQRYAGLSSAKTTYPRNGFVRANGTFATAYRTEPGSQWYQVQSDYPELIATPQLVQNRFQGTSLEPGGCDYLVRALPATTLAASYVITGTGQIRFSSTDFESEAICTNAGGEPCSRYLSLDTEESLELERVANSSARPEFVSEGSGCELVEDITQIDQSDRFSASVRITEDQAICTFDFPSTSSSGRVTIAVQAGENSQIRYRAEGAGSDIVCGDGTRTEQCAGEVPRGATIVFLADLANLSDARKDDWVPLWEGMCVTSLDDPWVATLDTVAEGDNCFFTVVEKGPECAMRDPYTLHLGYNSPLAISERPSTVLLMPQRLIPYLTFAEVRPVPQEPFSSVWIFVDD